MKRIKKRIAKLSIREKLIFYSYLVVTPILIFISTLLFIHNYKNALENEKKACIQSVKNLSDNIDSLQKTMTELGTYISINTEIKRILTADNPEELNKDGQLWVNEAPMQIVQDMLALNAHMKTVAIYPENKVIPYLRCLDSTAYLPDIEQVRQTDIYRQTVKSRGKLLWRRVGKKASDTYVSNRNEKIVLYREIFDLAKRRKLGYLVIGSSAEKFDTLCKNALLNEREEIVVLSNDGAELVRYGGMQDEEVNEIMEQCIPESGKEEIYTEKKGYMVYGCRNEDTGTTIYKLVPQREIRELIASILVTPVLFLLGFLIGLYPILIFVSNRVSKPLKNLSLAMNEFKKGDFSQKVKVETMDEVGEASACFNAMVDDMKRLIDKNYVMALKEKESELDVLQAQINPHFLYNALDSLYWQTLENGDEKTAEDIMALADLFRLVLNRGEGIVTVQNELELLERYLHIQKMRFGKRLNYRIKVAEELFGEKIPKLILQPFVENAIVHGFEKGGDSYELSILGRRDGADMVFYIKDTGVGMSPEQIKAIWRQEDTRQYAGQRIGRYAIRNVKERLELKYQNSFLLEIESAEGKGTTVILRLPCGGIEVQNGN